MTITIEELDVITPEPYSPSKHILENNTSQGLERVLTPSSYPYLVIQYETKGGNVKSVPFGQFELIYVLNGHLNVNWEKRSIISQELNDEGELDLYSGEFLLKPSDLCLKLSNRHDVTILTSTHKFNHENKTITYDKYEFEKETESKVQKNRVFHTVEGKPWGREHVLTPPSAPFMFKRLNILGDEGPSIQYHNHKIEFGYIESGETSYFEEQDGIMKNFIQKAGDFSYLMPNTIHGYKGIARDTILLEVSTPDPIGNDVVRIADRYGRAGISGHIANEHQ